MTLYNGYTKKVVRLNWVYRSWINNYTSRCKKHSEIFTGKQIDLLLFIGRKEDDSNSKSRRTKKH